MTRSRSARLILAAVLLLVVSTRSHAGGVETSGDILQLAIPLAGFALAVGHNDGEGSLQLGKASLANLGVTWALKYATDRRRPNGRPRSFPSAHTSVSFTGATFVHKRYGWKHAVLPYIAAAYVGWTRYEVKAHYASDVFAGAAIGALAGWYFATPFSEHEVTVIPIALDGGGYIQVSARW